MLRPVVWKLERVRIPDSKSAYFSAFDLIFYQDPLLRKTRAMQKTKLIQLFLITLPLSDDDVSRTTFFYDLLFNFYNDEKDQN